MRGDAQKWAKNNPDKIKAIATKSRTKNKHKHNKTRQRKELNNLKKIEKRKMY